MNGLSLFEDMAEEFLEGRLARLLGGRLHPLDIANAIARAMEDNQSVSRKGYALAPNNFLVMVNPSDYKVLQPGLEALQRQLAAFTLRLAAREHLHLVGSLRIVIQPSIEVPATRSRVSAYLDAQELDGIESGRTEPLSAESDAPAGNLLGPLPT